MTGLEALPFLGETGHVISLVGGGGKTTLLYALARWYSAQGQRVLVSTTTHIQRPDANYATDEAARDALWQAGTYAVAGVSAEGGKLTMPPHLADWIAEADTVLLEADGAKRHPCKAPAAHEPVLLRSSDIVLAAAGLSAVGKPLQDVCFRLEAACTLLAGKAAGRRCRREKKRRHAEILRRPQPGRRRGPPCSRGTDTCHLERNLRCNRIFDTLRGRGESLMAKEDKIVFCTGGGCTAKLGAGVLSHILEKLPRGEKDPDLLGYDSRDDAAVYRITDNIALVQTVDFFPPMVDDPYTFGQIAAANALSDVYAMGGEVKTALNLVCFPESMDLNILGEILRGGAEKVAEAGGILAGGHSIADTGVKYGLSVTGLVDPRRLTANDTGKPGDKLILTKALGVGLICTANRVGEAAPGAMDAAVASMTTLNKSAAEINRNYDVHAATDVTGFSFLGHLHEMMGGRLSCRIDGSAVPVLPGAWQAADDCLYTAAGQRNRNHTGPFVRFENVPFAMQEILFDPQTSGGLLLAVAPKEAESLRDELQKAGLPAQIVGEITEKQDTEIFVSYPE